jgi:cysteine-rich repeat protein
MRHLRGGVLVIQLALYLGPGAAHALDLTGKWRFRPTSIPIAEIVQVTQSGSALSFTLNGLAFSGTVSTGGQFATYNVTTTPFIAGIAGRILPSENTLDGRAVVFPLPPQLPSAGGLFATRCTCDDGNTVAGDGCDAECQVEPCWTCVGDPSVCVPASDGSACDDRHDCTTGETCSAGACGGGTSVSPCIDMTGRWNRHREVPDLGQALDFATDFIQRGGDVFAGTYVGVVDSTTGAFDLRTANSNLFCDFDPLVGTVEPSGETYGATGSVGVPNEFTPDECEPFPLTETGTRCGNGTLDPTEACDDGNLVAGDGCSAACAVESCWACAGGSSCVPAVRASCTASLVPDRSSLLVKNRGDDADDRIGWAWKKGEATLDELGDPVGGGGYALCVFDESSLAPALAFAATIPGGGTCDGSPCWRSTGDGFVFKSRSAAPDGIVMAKLKTGSGGGAKALVKGKGVHLSDRPNGLPTLPLATPLRVQLVGEDGLCLETTHDGSSVLKNDPARGVFKARGSP